MPLKIIANLFPAAYHDRIYMVGGCVRDLLLGNSPSDIDLTVSIPPEVMHECGFRLVNSRTTRAIWFMHLQGVGIVEATQWGCSDSLEDDLRQRDFTINAMAMDLNGKLYDPLGGSCDLAKRIIRACNTGCFKDDPLRIFRALRFEAHGWQMEAGTSGLVTSSELESCLKKIPVERFSREMLKALQGSNPERFFMRMIELNTGAVFLPEPFRMVHIPAGPVQHHPEGSLFAHALEVLKKVAKEDPEPLTRFCAFFHDIGKLATDTANYPKHHGHDRTGYRLAPLLCQRLRLPAVYGRSLTWISKLHTVMNSWSALRVSTRIRIAEQALRAGIAVMLPVICSADKAGAVPEEEWLETVRIASMGVADLGIDKDRLERLSLNSRKTYIMQRRVECMTGQKQKKAG